MNDVERTSHAAARLEYHHSSDVQTIIARARDLQDIRERWTVPTFMDGSGREGSALERVKTLVTRNTVYRVTSSDTYAVVSEVAA